MFVQFGCISSHLSSLPSAQEYKFQLATSFTPFHQNYTATVCKRLDGRVLSSSESLEVDKHHKQWA